MTMAKLRKSELLIFPKTNNLLKNKHWFYKKDLNFAITLEVFQNQKLSLYAKNNPFALLVCQITSHGQITN